MKEKKLKLPKFSYGTICLKILDEFKKHHNLDESLAVPGLKDKPHEAMEKIFDIMLHSMGKEKREQAIDDSMAYYNDLPPSVR